MHKSKMGAAQARPVTVTGVQTIMVNCPFKEKNEQNQQASQGQWTDSIDFSMGSFRFHNRLLPMPEVHCTAREALLSDHIRPPNKVTASGLHAKASQLCSGFQAPA